MSGTRLTATTPPAAVRSPVAALLPAWSGACPYRTRAAAEAIGLVRTFTPGSTAYTVTLRLAAQLAMADLSTRMATGADARHVAIYVLSCGPVGATLSRAIEDKAHPGTFAEAVFTLLAD